MYKRQEQETASDAAAFRAGDVTVEFAETDSSLAVFVQAQNTPVRELVLTWKAMFGGAGEVLGDTWEPVSYTHLGRKSRTYPGRLQRFLRPIQSL